MMTTTTTNRYTLVLRPVMNVEFDEHGNCRGHSLSMDVRPEYVYDKVTDEAFSVAQLPTSIREMVEEYMGTLELVRFFQPGPQPDEPF